MNVDHLKAFHRVAETGNFTQAARDLFLTQPAVSMQVQSLEHSLGVMLFDRSRRRISLTSEGEVLYRYTRKIFGIMQEMQNEFQNLNALQTGELTLGTSSLMGTYYLPFFVGSYHRRHPGVRFTLAINNSHAVAEMVYQGDIEIGFGGSSSAHPGLSQYFLHREPLIIVVGRHSPLIEHVGPLRAEDLVGEPFVMREKGTRITNKVTTWLRNVSQGTAASSLVTVDNMEVAKQLVAGGFGITALPRHAAATEIAAGQLFPLQLEDFEMHVNYFLIYMAGRKLSRVAQSFLALLFEHGIPLPEDLLEAVR